MKRKREINNFMEGNFMDYLNPEDEYGMYREDDTGLGRASRLTTEPNDLFGFYGEPEASYRALSEPTTPNLTDREKASQYRNYKQRRKDIIKTGGAPLPEERQNDGMFFNDTTDIMKKSRSGGIGGFSI